MAEVAARRPRADARFFNGMAVVVATSTVLWWITGVIKFSAPGKASDVLVVAAFGLLFAIALGVAAYVVALGPGALLWNLGMRIGEKLSLSERLTAQLTAPLVAVIVAMFCIFLFALLTQSAHAIDLRLVMEAVLVAIPSAVVAEIYACLAWPKDDAREGSGT